MDVRVIWQNVEGTRRIVFQEWPTLSEFDSGFDPQIFFEVWKPATDAHAGRGSGEWVSRDIVEDRGIQFGQGWAEAAIVQIVQERDAERNANSREREGM